MAAIRERMSDALDLGSAVSTLGVVATTVVLYQHAGVIGVIAGAIIGLLWFRVPVAYAFAAGQLATIAFLGVDPAFTDMATVQAGLLALLAGETLRDDRAIEATITFAGGFLILLALGIGTIQSTGSIVIAALAILFVAALIAYALHRYELVALGLVEGTP